MAQASRNVNPLSAYYKERKMLIYTGFFRDNPEKHDIWYTARAVVNWGGLLLVYTSMSISLVHQLDDFDKLVDTIFLFLAFTISICKMMVLTTNTSKLAKIEGILTGSIFNNHTQEQDELISTKLLLVNRASRIFRFLCMSVVTIYSLFPFFNITQTPVPGWLPFDVTAHKYEVWVFQTIVFFITILNHCGVDVITCALILLGSAQFEILKDSLMNVGASRKENDGVVEKLKVCVVHHQELLRYVQLVESMFSVGIFVQFVATSSLICIALFELTFVDPNSFKYLLFLFVLVGTTMQLLIYCLCGHDLILKSEGVLEACYFSEWCEFEPSAKKMLIFIMERSKNPVVMTVGGLFTLSLVTLLQILKSSYSFYAVLQSVYK